MKGCLTFTCQACGGRYVSDWTDDEAQAECRELFGDIPLSQQVVLCTPCFAKMPHPRDTVDGERVVA